MCLPLTWHQRAPLGRDRESFWEQGRRRDAAAPPIALYTRGGLCPLGWQVTVTAHEPHYKDFTLREALMPQGRRRVFATGLRWLICSPWRRCPCFCSTWCCRGRGAQHPLDAEPRQDVHELVAHTELPGNSLTSETSVQGSICPESHQHGWKCSRMLPPLARCSCTQLRPTPQLISARKGSVRAGQMAQGGSLAMPTRPAETMQLRRLRSHHRALPSHEAASLEPALRRQWPRASVHLAFTSFFPN